MCLCPWLLRCPGGRRVSCRAILQGIHGPLLLPHLRKEARSQCGDNKGCKTVRPTRKTPPPLLQTVTSQVPSACDIPASPVVKVVRSPPCLCLRCYCHAEVLAEGREHEMVVEDGPCGYQPRPVSSYRGRDLRS